MCTLCLYTAAIPVEIGSSLSGSLEAGDVVRYEIDVPIHGLSLNICVSQGEIEFYGSYIIPNPNSALNDFMLLVGTETHCVNVTVDSSGESQGSGSATLFVSLEGNDPLSNFEIAVSSIEPPVVEDDNDRGSGESDVNYPDEGT